MRRFSRRGFLGASAGAAGAAVVAKTVGLGEEVASPVEYADTQQVMTVNVSAKDAMAQKMGYALARDYDRNLLLLSLSPKDMIRREFAMRGYDAS